MGALTPPGRVFSSDFATFSVLLRHTLTSTPPLLKVAAGRAARGFAVAGFVSLVNEKTPFEILNAVAV